MNTTQCTYSNKGVMIIWNGGNLFSIYKEKDDYAIKYITCVRCNSITNTRHAKLYSSTLAKKYA